MDLDLLRKLRALEVALHRPAVRGDAARINRLMKNPVIEASDTL